MKAWYLYVLRTACDRLYTGISTDVTRRMAEHESGRRGARSLRARGPLTLEFQVEIGDRGAALRAEYRFKQLDRHSKDSLVGQQPDRATLLKALGLEGAPGATATTHKKRGQPGG